MDAAALLKKQGIELESTEPGDYATTCPQCSAKRKPGNQNKKCLGVHIDAKGACWRCNHCGWSGPERDDGGADDFEATYDYHDADGAFLFQKVRNKPSASNRFLCRRREAGIWVWGLKGIKVKPLYRLPEVIKAVTAGRIILLVEGEKDADNCWRIGLAATCNFDGTTDVIKQPKAKPKWRAEYSEMLRGADVVVLNDNDAPGYAHADTAARMLSGVSKRVRRLDLAKHWPEIPKGGDVSDWLKSKLGRTRDEVREELLALIEGAPDYELPPDAKEKAPPPNSNGTDDAAELERLARLTPLDYERARKDAGKRLGISRLALLDALVKAKRTELGFDGADDKQGHAIEFATSEPWPEPVHGAELLDEIAKAIGVHVIMAEHARYACALWVVHSYLLDHFMISPRLAIRSPVKGCGKTTLLDVLSRLVPRPLPAANVSPSAIFRVIEGHRPTLLIDEADTLFGEGDDALRGVLNSGHRRGGTVLRVVGDDHEPRAFATYAATAIALIGALPGTLADRSIDIGLARRKPDETIMAFRLDRTGGLDTLARQCARWAQDHGERVGAIDPPVPAGLYNRAADNWRPLLAIAEAVDGLWPERAYSAALKTVGGDADEASRLELLLGDIRDVFDELKVDTVLSAELIENLVEIVPRPWAEYGKSGKPITQNKLVRLLKPLGILPENVGRNRVRHYRRERFEEAFGRYLTSKGDSNLSTSPNADEMGTSEPSQTSHPGNGREDWKCEKPNNDGEKRGREVAKGDIGEKARTQTLKSTDGMPLYSGPVVEVPNMPPDPLDEHGAPLTDDPGLGEVRRQNGQGQGLSQRTILDLARWYIERADDQRQGTGDVDSTVLDADLRQVLAEQVFPEFIEVEFERIMQAVFNV
jgi:hypothetical protein